MGKSRRVLPASFAAAPVVGTAVPKRRRIARKTSGSPVRECCLAVWNALNTILERHEHAEERHGQSDRADLLLEVIDNTKHLRDALTHALRPGTGHVPNTYAGREGCDECAASGE